jgi:hypothetical protein
MPVRSMLCLCSIVALIVVSGVGGASAQEATVAPSGEALPPGAEVAGLSLAEWSARSWQWSFSLPVDVNPVADETGDFCGNGQSGPVFFLAGAAQNAERACVVPLGVHLFVPLAGAECSTVEPPPFFGRDEAELRNCATNAVDMAENAFGISTMRLTVDGQDVTDLSAYRAVTPLFTLWLPEDNLLGATRRTANSVADGYQVMLSPLSEGEHVVEIVNPGAQPVTITYHLTVSSGAHVETTASPVASPAS